MTETTLTIRRPDDFHVHLRDGDMLKAVAPYTARSFGRALVMPNTKPPVTTTAKARAYRDAVLDAVPPGSDFNPLMALYLTDATDPDDLEAGFKDGVLTAAKLYPAGATTNSDQGVTDLQSLVPVLERLQRLGMVLSIHGEVADEDVDIFDREAVFIDRVLIPLRRNFPGLKIVLEHLTTARAVDYVLAESQHGTIAGTLTAHHLWINRNAMFLGGLRPHAYCLPVAKREKDRLALVAAATSGARMFFLGTDSAPHPRTAKETDGGKGGIFTAPSALALYAQLFDEQGALDRFEAFAAENGAAFYGLTPNKGTVRLEKLAAEVEDDFKPILTASGAEIIPFFCPAPLLWRQSADL